MKQRLTLELDESVRRRLKAAAKQRGISMRHYCQAAIEKQLARDEAPEPPVPPFGHEALDRIEALRDEVFSGETLSGDSVDFIRQARATRSDI